MNTTRMERSLVLKKIDKAKRQNAIEKVIYGYEGNQSNIYVKFKCGVDIMYSTYKKNQKTDDVYPKCVGDVYRCFLECQPKLCLYKSVDECDMSVNYGDIKRIHDESLLCVDINRCYYNVAHVLGFLDDATYERYADKKYKKSVNIAIGKCYTMEKTISYNGEKNQLKRNPLAQIRSNILDYVSQLYKEVAKEIDIVCFNTDAFHFEKVDEETDKKNIERIKSIIEKYGLTCKMQ